MGNPYAPPHRAVGHFSPYGELGLAGRGALLRSGGRPRRIPDLLADTIVVKD